MILAPGTSNIPVSHTHSCTGGAVHCTLPTQTSTLCIESLSHESLQLPVYMILQSPLSLIQALSASTQIVKPRQIYSWCRWNVKLWWDKERNLQRALKNSWKALCFMHREEKINLPISGTESEVAGMISATSSMNTVRESRTVIPAGSEHVGERWATWSMQLLLWCLCC